MCDLLTEEKNGKMFERNGNNCDFRSTTNKMFVKFVSDGSVQKAGFSATFIKELDECELKDHGCEHNCINTLGGYQCSCNIGYELHSDKKTCESESFFFKLFSFNELLNAKAAFLTKHFGFLLKFNQNDTIFLYLFRCMRWNY